MINIIHAACRECAGVGDVRRGSRLSQVAAVRERVAARDWAGAREVLDGLPPSGRSIAIRAVGELDGSEEFLGEVVDRDPADSAAAAALGCRLTAIGWGIRSRARAEFVSGEQFASFREWLCRAEAVLIEGVARNPHDPALRTARLATARGLEVGLAEVRRRYDKGTAARQRIDPLIPAAVRVDQPARDPGRIPQPEPGAAATLRAEERGDRAWTLLKMVVLIPLTLFAAGIAVLLALAPTEGDADFWVTVGTTVLLAGLAARGSFTIYRLWRRARRR